MKASRPSLVSGAAALERHRSRERKTSSLDFNGDLSASPSAQSGQAAVLGLQAAIDDRQHGRWRARQKAGPRHPRRSLAASEVDPEHDRPDRQREGRRRVRADELGQRPCVEAHPDAEEDPGDRNDRFRRQRSPSR